MTEDGDREYLGQPRGYRLLTRRMPRTASSASRRRASTRPAWRPCSTLRGVGPWWIQQACAELRAGRMAILPLVCTQGRLTRPFPRAPTSDAGVLDQPHRMPLRSFLR